ncbi:hypothetical protein GCM10011492_01190 [Flexivirga endophytica]|uniref:Transcription termination factor Rho n=1 Tax=Flexivirga endophytica TaxID=1849103 RepID=A0A916SSC4_9MICO|nr:transcription termination factor Rho [Flexivirga endophytica]GGB15282.1 hypothetical protein GCM10011492_01190 [Flexivirga endophytica]GHB64977.1 hypothetical protein GCM10008112_37300 [Flexivirga endophytica]
MTDTTELSAPAAAPASSSSGTSKGSLSTMKLDELKQLAVTMGISGTSKMRKSDVLSAIRERGGENKSAAPDSAQSTPRRSRRAASAPAGPAESAAPQTVPADSKPADSKPADDKPADSKPADSRPADSRPADSRPADNAADKPAEPADQQRNERDGQRADNGDKRGDHNRADSGDSDRGNRGNNRQGDQQQGGNNRQGDQQQGGNDRGNSGDRTDRGNDRNDRGNRQGGNTDRGDRNNDGDRQGGNNRQGGNRQGGNTDRGNRNNDRGDRWNDDDGGNRNRRRQRGRDRKRGRGRGADDFGDVDTQVREDDVLVPVAGIVDVLDNYAFVRTSGYLAGPNDVYVPMGMVKKNGMRKGDAVTGAIRALREGEQLPARQKFNALVRLDTVNGMTPEQAKQRVEFGKLTPLYPQERLRLEDDPKHLTNRVIDLVAPIGKGQRGLIVAPSKSGKTMVMQAIANAITTNNPECHLMVVLVDERPEEVTDFQRSVKGEVISSTFDRPATDHTEVAELAIARAKRLVELGQDVVVLLDGITRLGRAYNLAAPASGRIMSGGVDSAALYPPKKFFGAARNIENGGSLTILATALIESGSRMDEVIFEEFKGTGNWELRLSRQLAERRIYPAVDVNQSSTRREEILLGGDELKIMWKLRRVLAALDSQQSIEVLLDRLKKTASNTEFLMQVQQTSSIKLDDED